MATSDPLEAYWGLWLQLDALSDEQLESAEADALRDEGDPFWYALSAGQHRELKKRIKAHQAGKGSPRG